MSDNDFAQPIASVALIAVGTSLLFPAATMLGLVPPASMATTGIAMAAMGIAGGIAGWYIHKSTSASASVRAGKEGGISREVSAPALQAGMAPELQAQQAPEKEWARREGLYENSQAPRER